MTVVDEGEFGDRAVDFDEGTDSTIFDEPVQVHMWFNGRVGFRDIAVKIKIESTR